MFQLAAIGSRKLGSNWRSGSVSLGNRDVNSATGFLIADHVTEDVDLFTARLNYKFGGPGVARY
jgi:hypothetical protein